MSAPSSRVARYWRRREAEQCVQCGAGLQEDDGVRCVECVAGANAGQRRWRRSAKGRANERAQVAAAIAAGRCATCPRPAAPGRKLCMHHLALQAQRQARYLDRLEQRRAP